MLSVMQKIKLRRIVHEILHDPRRSKKAMTKAGRSLTQKPSGEGARRAVGERQPLPHFDGR